MAGRSAVAFFVGLHAASAALCNLDGNWTSSRKGTAPEDVVHIQFYQQEGQTDFTLRATPWGSTLSYGHIVDEDTADIFFVGGSLEPVTLSASQLAGPAPNCTYTSSGWCKFPYCDVPEPQWPAWPEPEVPTWEANWNLTQSTTIQPSSSGYFTPAHPWGLISLDWSVANQVWFRGNTSNTTCEATSLEGCRRLKDAGLATRCFIYHNMELGLEWLETQRRVMYNESLAHYFLQYTDGEGHKNGTIYNERISFGDQFFWDFRDPAAADYYIQSVLESISDPAVDGTFTDDVDGVPDVRVCARAGCSAARRNKRQCERTGGVV
jgi:hypothetical protein